MEPTASYKLFLIKKYVYIFIFLVLMFVVFFVSSQLVSSIVLTTLLFAHFNLTPWYSYELVRLLRRRKGFKPHRKQLLLLINPLLKVPPAILQIIKVGMTKQIEKYTPYHCRLFPMKIRHLHLKQIR